jgi:hypothetical protein
VCSAGVGCVQPAPTDYSRPSHLAWPGGRFLFAGRTEGRE